MSNVKVLLDNAQSSSVFVVMAATSTRDFANERVVRCRLTSHTLLVALDHASACADTRQTPQKVVIGFPMEKRLITLHQVGCGSGLLEALVLHDGSQKNKTNQSDGEYASDSHDIHGVEVESCTNTYLYLPPARFHRVPTTSSLHPDALLADTLLFVYPRTSTLIAAYCSVCANGALQKVVILAHQSDWIDVQAIVHATFSQVDLIEDCGLPPHEILAVATRAKAH